MSATPLAPAVAVSTGAQDATAVTTNGGASAEGAAVPAGDSGNMRQTQRAARATQHAPAAASMLQRVSAPDSEVASSVSGEHAHGAEVQEELASLRLRVADLENQLQLQRERLDLITALLSKHGVRTSASHRCPFAAHRCRMLLLATACLIVCPADACRTRAVGGGRGSGPDALCQRPRSAPLRRGPSRLPGGARLCRMSHAAWRAGASFSATPQALSTDSTHVGVPSIAGTCPPPALPLAPRAHVRALLPQATCARRAPAPPSWADKAGSCATLCSKVIGKGGRRPTTPAVSRRAVACCAIGSHLYYYATQEVFARHRDAIKSRYAALTAGAARAADTTPVRVTADQLTCCITL